MPKPVLSDSLFNANDVATAILDSAELSVTNQDLGVVDRSSLFTFASGWAGTKIAFSFNGFMFLNINCNHAGGTPADAETMLSTSDASFYADQAYFMPTLGYEGDRGTYVRIGTDGIINVHNPVNLSNANFYVLANGWYRF